MDKEIKRLIGLERAEFEKAKKHELIFWCAQILIMFITVACLYVTSVKLSYLLSLLVLIIAVIGYLFYYKSEISKAVAERARRTTSLVVSLGCEMSGKELTDLLTSFTVKESEGEKWEDSKYFKSKHKPGREKFRSLIQESVFFSKELYKECAKTAIIISVSLFLFSIVVLLTIPLVKNQTWSFVITRMICNTLVFLFSYNILDRFIRYRGAYVILDRMDERLEALNRDTSTNDILIGIFCDYNATVESTPIIPSAVYNKQRERLNKLWHKRSS